MDKPNNIIIDGAPFPLRDGDYAQDGHVYCKVCHERVDHDGISLLDKKMVFRRPCKCDREREAKIKEQERWMHIHTLKECCFHSPVQHGYTFENFDDKTCAGYVIAQNYVKNFDQMLKDNIGLVFYGKVGSGKTHLACAIANALIEERMISARMRTLTSIINELQCAGFDQNKNSILKRLSSVSLLILDDLGIERDTSYAREQVYNIINERYTCQKPTIFTTNLTLQMMESGGGQMDYQRIYSRILEMGIPVHVAGDDYRKKIKQQKMKQYEALLTDGKEVD